MEKEAKQDSQELTFDNVKDWLAEHKEDKDVLSIFESHIDRRITKAVETYRDNHFDSEIAKKLTETKGALTEKEKEISRREVLCELREETINKAMEEGINTKLALRLTGMNSANQPFSDLDLLIKEKDKWLEQGWHRNLKLSGKTPQTGDVEKHYNRLEEYGKDLKRNPELYSFDKYSQIAGGSK